MSEQDKKIPVSLSEYQALLSKARNYERHRLRANRAEAQVTILSRRIDLLEADLRAHSDAIRTYREREQYAQEREEARAKYIEAVKAEQYLGSSYVWQVKPERGEDKIPD